MCNLSDLVEERGVRKGEICGMLRTLGDMGFTMEAAINYVVLKLKTDWEEVSQIAETCWEM